MSTKISGGNNTPNEVNVTTDNKLSVALESVIEGNENNIGAVKMFCENDDGSIIGTANLLSPEVDDDYRIRTANDILLDHETFNYTAQNTGKFNYVTTTLTNLWTTAGLVTNGSNVTTTTIGATFGTYAEFPVLGSNSLYVEFEAGFTNQPVANATIDFGMFRRGATTQFAPLDGVYFRLNSSGLFGVVNNNGSETTSDAFNFIYLENVKYQFIITITQREIKFWINNICYGTIKTQVGQGQPFMSTTLPISVRHAHSGTASGIINLNISSYTLTIGGTDNTRLFGYSGNSVFGSYQGLSGGVMGGLTVYTNSTNPTAAVPANTTLTANLPNGLGGQAWETCTTALNTDVILMSYQVPAGTVSVQGKRLKIRGVKMSSFVQTTIAGGPWVASYALAVGHTSVSLATAEAVGAKKPRIILLPELTNAFTANQAAWTLCTTNGDRISYFEEPIYVDPGHFVAFTMKKVGVVGTAGVVAYNIQYDYTWE